MGTNEMNGIKKHHFPKGLEALSAEELETLAGKLENLNA